MYGREVTVGIKVVPVIKTIEGPLSKSKEWAAAKEKGQKFLYVIRLMSPASKGFICAVDKNAKAGDKFAAIDLRSTSWAGWPCRDNPGATKKAKVTKGKKVAKGKKSVKPAKAKKVTVPHKEGYTADVTVPSVS